MENKNYYPLRVDKKHGSAIVSCVDPKRSTYTQDNKDYEIHEYGGHIIAESLPSLELAQQLVDAYNEKYYVPGIRTDIFGELSEAKLVHSKFMDDPIQLKAIENAANLIITCLKNGGKIIACGNGGSMSDAMHFCSELTGKYNKNRPALAAVAISDPGHISCVGNDYGYNTIFSRFVSAHGKPGDILLAISTSGDSENVFIAVDNAIGKDMSVIFLTGNDGGEITRLKPAVEINVPSESTARIQEVHIKIIHILVMLIEKGMGYE